MGGGPRGELVAYNKAIGGVSYHKEERRIYSVDDEVVKNATIKVEDERVTGTPNGHL